MVEALVIEWSEKAWDGDVSGRLVDADGHVLYHHVSSDKHWLERDLTENFGRKAELESRYPEGFTVEWRCLDEMQPSDGSVGSEKGGQ